MKSNRFNLWRSLCVFLILSYVSLFHQLGRQPMQSWDESSYALNAQEMIENGNPIEVYLLGSPDLYNSKPPFGLWCMALSMKTLGFNTWGARMASAIFGLLSALLLWIIGIKATKNYWTALTLPLVLLSSYGFIGWHTARTGDMDSILTFWILLQSALIFAYTNTDLPKKANTYLILAGLAIAFGCLTKGIAGITALPGIMAWLIYKRKLKAIFLSKGFYIALVSFLTLVIGYYWLRSNLTPGYWQAVLQNEIGGRFGRQDFLNKESLPFYFYFEYMITQDRFFVWIFLLPLSIVYILISKPSAKKSIGLFSIFVFASISILLALSKTKLEWYDAPLYPFMAIIIGISFCILIEQKTKISTLLFICAFSLPFYKVVSNNVSAPKGPAIGSFLRQIRSGAHKKDKIYIVNSNPDFSLFFYAKKDRLNGNDNTVVFPTDPMSNGSYIITNQNPRDIDVNNLYNLELVRTYKECKYYRILSKK